MTSPSLRLETLPIDILIDIFKALPSFPDVLSLILTHRSFHAVWAANLNEIAQSIAHREFQPWDDAINLMLEQKQPDPTDDVITSAATESSMRRLAVEHLAQMHYNYQYVRALERKHDLWKQQWWNSPMSDSERLRFRRAAYRMWKFMLTMTMPRCEAMCEGFGIAEMTDMQVVGRRFYIHVPWEVPGFPDFSEFSDGTAVNSLEGMLRRRIAEMVRCDPEVDQDEVYEWKKEYGDLMLQDPTIRGKECMERMGKLAECDKWWKEKKEDPQQL